MPRSRPWPQAGDYSTEIQNPQSCFNDSELKGSSVVAFPSGLPKRWCGNFAIVYRLQCNIRTLALRCFIKPVTNQQQQRYELLSQHLRRFSVETLADPAYLPQGIWVSTSTQWYPVVLMEWVSGEQLHKYVGDHLQQPQVLARLAARWREVVSGLRGAHVAHGDLQHGNILVDSRGQIRLVDYDGVFIPALQHQPPDNDEVGHFNYQ